MSEEKKSPVGKTVEALGANPGSTTEQLAERAGLGLSTVRKALVQLEAQGKASRSVGGREAGRKLPDTWSADGDPAPPEPKPAGKAATTEAKSSERLPKGRLRELILTHLRSVPGEAQSPSAVGKAIGHSAGAISNALSKMAESGEVKEVSSKPKRYSSNA